MGQPEKEEAADQATIGVEDEELAAAEALVAPPGDAADGGQKEEGRRWGSWGVQLPEIGKVKGALTARTTSLKVVSATTASFFLVLLFVATVMYSQGIDVSSFTFQSGFRVVNIRPSDYAHIPEHQFNCTATATATANLTLTCPANYQNSSTGRHSPSQETCPDYFRWIHEDMKTWRKHGITRDMVEEVIKTPQFRHFRVVIVNGTAYVKQYDRAFQTRDVFTLWGVLQLLKMYPGQVPDLDLVFQCHDQPSIKKGQYDEDKVPPLFHYCGSDDTYDIVFPDWSFWGWPEINIKPWPQLKEELEQGNKMMNWTDREPYAYWKGNLYTGARRKLGTCNSTKDYNSIIYQQDWGKEIREGFKNSDMSKQCTHKYKIYMEGNAWSVSEKYILACDSMSLLVNPFFYDFFTRSLTPMKHYWPINPNTICNSLKFATDWGNRNPEKAQEIGKAGTRFVQEEITMQHVYDYMFHVLSEYGKLLAYRPTVPPGSVELCSEKWVCTSNDLERRYKVDTIVEDDTTRRPCSLPPPFDPQTVTKLREEKADAIKKVERWERDGNAT